MWAHPDVLLLRGAEVTTYAGHGNAVGISSYVDHRIGYHGRTINGVLDDIEAQQGILLVNHPQLDLGSLCLGCAWKHADTNWDKVAGIELITGNYELGVILFVPKVLAMWDGLLDQGHRIAAVGGSDDHTAGLNEGPTDSPLGSPTTRVLADELSEAAIIEGVRRGRTIVQLRGPDDPLVELTVRRPGPAIAELGDQVTGVDRVALGVHVVGGDGSTVQLWRNGARLGEPIAIAGGDTTVTFDDVPGEGAFRYRAELSQQSKRLVITSHIYVDAVAAERRRWWGRWVRGRWRCKRRRGARAGRARAAAAPSEKRTRAGLGACRP